jgi:hypothetical protein
MAYIFNYVFQGTCVGGNLIKWHSCLSVYHNSRVVHSVAWISGHSTFKYAVHSTGLI